MAKSSEKKRFASKAILAPRLVFICCVAFLFCFGLVMIYSASSITSIANFGTPSHYVINQLISAGIALVIMLPLTIIPYYRLARENILFAFWGITMIALMATYVIGKEAGGAERWISIGSFNIQPSEFAKATTLVLCSYEVIRYRMGQITIGSLAVRGGVPLAVTGAAILFQPDLGTDIILFLGILAMLWLAEFPARWAALTIGAGAAFAGLASLAKPYRLARLMVFLDPWSDPYGNGYQTIQGIYAFASGGLTGVGLGMSKQKYLYLPAAHTDFIFAIIGEELGLVGCAIVIIAFALFIWSGIQIARNCGDLFGRLIAGGATAMIGFQALLNMFCAVGAFPVTGKPLPFVSYGGSSLIATFLLVGIILNVSFHSSSGKSNVRENLVLLDGNAAQDWAIPKSSSSQRNTRVRTSDDSLDEKTGRVIHASKRFGNNTSASSSRSRSHNNQSRNSNSSSQRVSSNTSSRRQSRYDRFS